MPWRLTPALPRLQCSQVEELLWLWVTHVLVERLLLSVEGVGPNSFGRLDCNSQMPVCAAEVETLSIVLFEHCGGLSACVRV